MFFIGFRAKKSLNSYAEICLEFSCGKIRFQFSRSEICSQLSYRKIGEFGSLDEKRLIQSFDFIYKLINIIIMFVFLYAKNDFQLSPQKLYSPNKETRISLRKKVEARYGSN